MMSAIEHLPWRYEHWDGSPTRLNPRDVHTAISISENRDGLVFSEEVIRDEDIPALCERTAIHKVDTKWSLQLLLTTVDLVDKGPLLKMNTDLGYSLAAIRALSSQWHIPHTYIPPRSSPRPMAQSFSPILGDASWRGLFQVVPKGSASGLVVTHNASTHQTFGVCTDMLGEEIARVLHQLRCFPIFASSETFIPVILAASQINFMEKKQDEYSQDVKDAELLLGYKRTRLPDLRSDQVADLRDIPKRLHQHSVRLSRNDRRCSVMESILNCLQDQLRNPSDGVYPAVGIELLEKVIYLRSRLEISRWAVQREREGVQTMVQTVYAELQQQDNQLSHRYGADMRLITIITLIFLPGTFVATFFSTSFWDFAPENQGSKVSSWVWLYFVLTAGLSLLVLLVWKKFGTFRQLAAYMVRTFPQSSLLKRMAREKKQGDEESGEKSE